MKRLLLALLLLVAAPTAFAQQLINCQNYPTQVPCTTSGPTNTGNGDNASVSFGKDNANWLALQSDGIFSGNINFTSGTFGATMPTGGNLGNGTLNVSTGYYVNGVIVPNYPRTAAEIAAGVTPVNYGYSSDPENILRFGTNTTPGTTDMTTALENAIAGLPSTGGKVILPAGTYLISSTIVITKPVILEGDGDAVVGTTAPTVLNKASSLHGPLFMIEGNGGNNSIVENLLINGISGNTDNGIDILANSVTVRNVGVTGMGQDGIRVGDDAGTYNANRFRLEQISSYSNVRYGIYIDSDSNAASWSAASPNANGGTVTSPFVAHNGSDGVYVYSAGADTFQGGVYEQNTGHGVHIGGWAQWIMVFGGDINEANTAGDVLIDAGATSNPQGNMFVANDIGTYSDNSTGSQKTLLVNQKNANIPQAVIAAPVAGTALTVNGGSSSTYAEQILAPSTQNAQGIGLNIEQELNHSGAANWDDFAQATEAFTPTSDTQNFTGQVTGVYGSFSHFGSGSLAAGYGGAFEAFNPGAATGVVVIGLSGTANNGGVSAGNPVQTPTNNGTAATARALDLVVNNYSSGAITNGQGIYINTPNLYSTGGITNDYGLEIADQNKGTNNYAIYTGKGLVHFGDVMQLASYTVSTLPTCNTANKGGMAYVTDATSPTYNGALTGGGSVTVPVFCNGSAWSSH